MKVFLKVLLFVVTLAGIAGTVFFYVNYSKVSKEKEMYIQENAQLQSNIDAIGPVTTVYTVVDDMFSGNVISADDFQELTIPVSAVTDQTVLYVDSIVGNLYKVDVHPGTVLTSDLVMTNEFDENAYQQDMVFDFLPLGIRAGDYVDIKMTLPYGETFVVIPHKRVENVVIDSHVINVYLTPAQQLLWQSALRDKALFGEIGLAVYCTKYIEPGVQDETFANYPIRQEMEAVAMIDNNVTDKTECINHDLRVGIDTLIAAVTIDEENEDGGKLSSGVNQEASGINTAIETYVDSKNSSNVTDDGDDSVVDLNSYEDVADELQELDSTVMEYSYE